MSGHFRIYEYVVSGATLVKLAMDFEASCNGLPQKRGELRINSSGPVASLGAPGDTTPEAFSCAARTNQVASTLVESGAATIYGIKTCDTMKKARDWLASHGVAYGFHDYKASGIDRARLEAWAGKEDSAALT